MGTLLKECPQVPGGGPQLHQPKVLCGVVDPIVVHGGRHVGRCGLHGLLRVTHGHTCAHGREHRQVVLAVAEGDRLARIDA